MDGIDEEELPEELQDVELFEGMHVVRGPYVPSSFEELIELWRGK